MSEPKRERVVVVTGAFGALGRAVAHRFREHGYRVALVDQARCPPDLFDDFGVPHLILGETELTVPEAATAALRSARDALGSIDVLVNVAGGFRWHATGAGSADVWDELFTINLKTALVVSEAALPHLLASASARIINVGSAAASTTAGAGMGAYTTAKAGVHKLTESLAAELADRAITVNAVLPGTLDTPRNRADMPMSDHSRWTSVASVAEVIVFLASERAGAVNGALIPVTGRG